MERLNTTNVTVRSVQQGTHKSMSKGPIKISLYGMDERSQKMLKLFLQGPCKNRAIIVKEHQAEVDLIDADLVSSPAALELRIAQYPLRPVIVLSIREIVLDNVVYLQKPVQLEAMLDAIEQVRQVISVQSHGLETTNQTQFQDNTPPVFLEKSIYKRQEKQQGLDFSECKKVNKHKTAILLTERNYSNYVGVSPEINYNDQVEWVTAYYRPEAYFLGIVQSVVSQARQGNNVLQLQFKGVSFVLFPKTNEIWCDADNEHLKALANKNLDHSDVREYEITTLALAESLFNGNDISMDKFWDMDALLWMLACWTSKGRFPDFLVYDQPVFLKSWPNFTRLLNTPHALQIAALLIERPRILANIIKVLDIEAQYVFVFISAACAVGLAGQAERNEDLLVEPPEVQQNNRRILLNQLVKKLNEH
jgi:hypothetical protein